MDMKMEIISGANVFVGNSPLPPPLFDAPMKFPLSPEEWDLASIESTLSPEVLDVPEMAIEQLGKELDFGQTMECPEMTENFDNQNNQWTWEVSQTMASPLYCHQEPLEFWQQQQQNTSFYWTPVEWWDPMSPLTESMPSISGQSSLFASRCPSASSSSPSFGLSFCGDFPHQQQWQPFTTPPMSSPSLATNFYGQFSELGYPMTAATFMPQNNNPIAAQTERNREIVAQLNPLHKFQERLQSVQRRLLGQQQRRKFSLKTGPSAANGNIGGKKSSDECSSRRRYAASRISLQKWQLELKYVLKNIEMVEKNKKTKEFKSKKMTAKIGKKKQSKISQK